MAIILNENKEKKKEKMNDGVMIQVTVSFLWTVYRDKNIIK